MAVTKGKLEARVRVSGTGWTVTAGGFSVSVPAADYYLSSGIDSQPSLLSAFATALTAATGQTWTVTGSLAEGGTGQVTIATTPASTLTWNTGYDLQDILGFSSNLASGTSWTSTYAARSVWLPNCPYVAHVGGAFEGMTETDATWQESAAGDVFGWSGQKKTVLSVRWDAITAARCWLVSETTYNQSFERFFLDVIFGEAAWAASPGGPIRFYRDAAVDNVYTAYKSTGTKDFNLPVFGEAAGLLYRVELPRLVKLPRAEEQP